MHDGSNAEPSSRTLRVLAASVLACFSLVGSASPQAPPGELSSEEPVDTVRVTAVGEERDDWDELADRLWRHLTYLHDREPRARAVRTWTPDPSGGPGSNWRTPVPGLSVPRPWSDPGGAS